MVPEWESDVAADEGADFPKVDNNVASNPKSSILSTSSPVVTAGECLIVASSVSKETEADSTPFIFFTSVLIEFEHDEHVIPPT